MGRGRAQVRFPEGGDTDSNCTDFITANVHTRGSQRFALDPGPRVSLQVTTAGSTSDYIKHDDADDLVVTAPVTASSSPTDKQDATWVEAAGLANPSCVSFESVNRPAATCGTRTSSSTCSQDGSALFAQDATFCPQAGNSGQGTSFQSVNFPGQVHPYFDHSVYLASNGGTTPGTPPPDGRATRAGWRPAMGTGIVRSWP